MADYMGTATGVLKENPDFVILAIGCLVQGLAFSVIFRNWGADKYTTMDGLKYGFWVGVLAGLGNNIIDYATSNMLDMTGALINGLIYIVFFCVMGFLVGLIYNKVNNLGASPRGIKWKLTLISTFREFGIGAF